SRAGRASLDRGPGPAHARGLPPRGRALGCGEHACRERAGACRAVRRGRARPEPLVARAVARGSAYFICQSYPIERVNLPGPGGPATVLATPHVVGRRGDER